MNYENLGRAESVKTEMERLAYRIKNMVKQPHHFKIEYADTKIPHHLREKAIVLVIEGMVSELATYVYTLVDLGVKFSPLPPEPEDEEDDDGQAS